MKQPNRDLVSPVEDNIIHLSIWLAKSPHDAFACFTDTTLLESWLAGCAIVEQAVGGKYELYWMPDDPENNSTIGCRITAYVPGQLLAFQWRSPVQFKHFANGADPLTHVTVAFIPENRGTTVHLLHTGWRNTPQWEQARLWQEHAWTEALTALKQLRFESCVFSIPIELDEYLESQRAVFQTAMDHAQRRLRDFANGHGWSHLLQEPLADSARFFSKKTEFDSELLKRAGQNPTTILPQTYCAAWVDHALLSVSPDLYAHVFPEGIEPDAFEKLLTHELAHRLHIRILEGNEDSMGPVWFYEGFALHAAGQLEHAAPPLSLNEILDIMKSPDRSDYRRYVTVFRFCLQNKPLHDLIRLANHPDFIQRILEKFTHL